MVVLAVVPAWWFVSVAKARSTVVNEASSVGAALEDHKQSGLGLLRHKTERSAQWRTVCLRSSRGACHLYNHFKSSLKHI